MFNTLLSRLTKIALLMVFSTIASITLNASHKIMPLGDSITWDWYYGDTRTDAERSGYRNHLWYQLQNEGYAVNFVGSRSNGGAVRPSYDGNNQGYTGWTSYQIADKVYSFLDKNTPDIILLHIGTNDSAYYSTTDGVGGVEKILREIDRFEKDKGIKIKVILAQIINLKKNPSWIDSFNNKLVTMAKQRISNGDEIVLVNMQSAVGWSLIDGIHPNNTGYEKMANVWYGALKNILKDDYAWLIPIYNIMLPQF